MPKIGDSHSEKKVTTAFTLLELLIVVMLLSLVYVVLIRSFSGGGAKTKRFDIESIKGLYAEASPARRTLVCLKDCSECYVSEGREKFQKLNVGLHKLKAYLVDQFSNPQRIDFGRFHDQPVCFRYNYYPDGSSDRMIVETDGTFYYLPTYFGNTVRYATLQEAVQRWERDSDDLHDSGNYY